MIETAVCWSCVVGLHEECLATIPVDGEDGYVTCCCALAPVGSDASGSAVKREPGRPASAIEDIADPISTGRRRAQMLYPITPGMVCEWAGLRRAGGGPAPIIGCTGNLIIEQKGGDPERGFVQGDRHHGPDKNTLANEPGNVHRICVFCHHRWHALNDKHYGKRPRTETGKVNGLVPFLPPAEIEWTKHDPDTKATAEEIEASEAYWARNRREADAVVVPPEEAPEIPTIELDYDPLI